MSEDGRNTPEEKSPTSNKMESKSKEELIKIVERLMVLKEKLNAQNSQLTTSNLSLCQTEEELRNQLEDEQQKSKNLLVELEQSQKNEQKMQQDLTVAQESLECFRLQNDTLKASYHNLQEEISNLQRSLSEVRLSMTHVEEDFTHRLNESQNTIETLQGEKQSFSEERVQLEQSIAHLQSTSETLRLQLNTVDQEKHSLLQEIDQDAEQISSVFPDIPALLQSVGIADEGFPQPSNLDSLLNLCSLLHQRCQVLQQNGSRETDEYVSSVQTEELDEYRVEIPQQTCPALDCILQHLCSWMNQPVDCPTWRLVLSRPLKQESDHLYIYLSLNDLTFLPGHVRDDLLAKENETSLELQNLRNQQTADQHQYEETIRLSSNSAREQDERYGLLVKQQQQLSDLLETKINDVKQLTERNLQLEEDLKEHRELFFEKSKQADDLDRQLQKTINQCDDIRTTVEQLRDEKAKAMNEFDRLSSQIENLNIEKAQLTQMIETLREDLQNNQSHLPQEEHDLAQTNAELKQKLEDQIRESNETIQDLETRQQKMKIILVRLQKELKEKNQQPKQSLVDLEIADYERTIKNLKETLTTKDNELDDLRVELTGVKEKSARLREEMHALEEQKSQTEERANKFETLLESTKKELHDAKDLEQERHYNDDNVRSLIDKLQLELDDNKVSISQLLAEKQQLTDRLHSHTDTTQRTIQLLEQNLRITQHDLSLAKQDYDTLNDDFNNYKIRAQSVLKQQSAPRDPQPAVMNRQVELEEAIARLQETLEESNRKIQSLVSDNERLQHGQDRLSELQAKLINESRKREQELRKQHQTELEKMENDSHELMRNNAVQNETLSTSFREKIAAIETDHARSLLLLQNQLQAAKREIELARQNNVENEKESSPVIFSNNEFTRDDLPWTHAERQQGEGSESASTEYQSTDIAVKTLENVLFGGTSNSSRPSSASTDKPRHILFEDAELERQRVEEELNKAKYRLLNTTELLNESELNNVRLGEQVSLLKDEIRRIERNMDRAESISNLEYLKNIILKFFILKSTPERLQLIPVLVTMLKLSPDEQSQLVRVAQQTTSIENNSTNNELETQSVTNSANANPPSSSSWTSYLNIW